MSDAGLITVGSHWSFGETVGRCVAAIEAHGLSVFARVDHAKNAASVGMALRPTELLIFGNPKGGTPLMQENQVSGLDLPVRALVWQDAEARVWLTYNDPRWLAARHGLGAPSQPALVAMTAGLAAIARDATQRDVGGERGAPASVRVLPTEPPNQ
ncbi:MAG TPA: DUF302 domain-containing protein [Polyangia bacterium]|nr:DUF302 domain-containing protein [Polyangia bacterium]